MKGSELYDIIYDLTYYRDRYSDAYYHHCWDSWCSWYRCVCGADNMCSVIGIIV